MSRSSLFFVAAFSCASLASSAWARAPLDEHMMMPAAQLKRITSGFGPRDDGFHPGIDLAAPYGSPVRAALGGTVIYAGRNGGYGNVVDLRSPDGLVTRYAHLSSIANYVRRGSLLDEGEPLGKIGTTGHAHGPHLHFEVRVRDKPIDPELYFDIKTNFMADR